jgi:hypothetical protein
MISLRSISAENGLGRKRWRHDLVNVSCKIQADIHSTHTLRPRSIAYTSLFHDLVFSLTPSRPTIENDGL